MSGAFDIADPNTAGVFPGAQQPQQPAQPATPPPAGDNEGKEREFVNQVRKLGRESGAGKEALPNLVVAIVDAVNTGALDPRKKFRNEKGEEVDAAHFIVETYSNEEGRKLSHERTALGKKTQASKILQIIKAARQTPIQGQPDFNFRGAIDRAISARPQLAQSNDKRKLKPAFDTYVSMARAQLKKKLPLSDADISEAMLRKAGYENDVTKELKRMYTRLSTLLSEKGTTDGIRINPDEPIFDNMEQVALAIEAAIKFYDPSFNQPEPQAQPQAQNSQGQTFSQELAGQNAAVDAQIKQTAAGIHPAQ